MYIYRFSNVSKSFEEAQKTCVRNGGILFEPKNQQQNEEVANAGDEFDGYFWWIGVDDKEREGRFQYSTTKQDINFSNWRSGEPADGKGELFEEDAKGGKESEDPIDLSNEEGKTVVDAGGETETDEEDIVDTGPLVSVNE